MPGKYSCNLERVECIRCCPPTRGSDRCEITIAVDGNKKPRIVKDLSPGGWYNINKRYEFDHHVTVSLKILEPVTLGMGAFAIVGNTNMTTAVLGKPTCEYKFRYTVSLPSDEIRRCMTKHINGRDRYIVTDLRHDTYSLFLQEGDLPEPLQDPNEQGEPYSQKYVQQDPQLADPSYINACGPVAGRNLLHWYNKDASWDTLVEDMRTNTWDEGMVIGLSAMLDPTLWPAMGTILSSMINAGSLPDDVESALDKHKPSGYELVKSVNQMSHNLITDQLSEGRPIVVLYAHPSGSLHWSVITGLYSQNGPLMVRLANANDLEYSAFSVGWQLNPLGSLFLGPVVKSFLGNPPFNIKPCTMMYYKKS